MKCPSLEHARPQVGPMILAAYDWRESCFWALVKKLTQTLRFSMMKRFLMLAVLAVPFLATVAQADEAAAADAKPKKKSHKEKKADKKAAKSDKAAPAPAGDAKPAGGDEMK